MIGRAQGIYRLPVAHGLFHTHYASTDLVGQFIRNIELKRD